MPITNQQPSLRTIVVGVNDLATTHPDIAALWHPTKNFPATPQQITKGTKTKRWWICSEGHEDFALPSNVITKNGRCSYCSGNKLLVGVNDFATLFPQVAKEWHPTLNGTVKPSDIFAGARKKYWWKCSTCEQSWEAPVTNRGSKGTGCPVCAGQKIVEGVNDLATVLPKVAALWHPTLNQDLTPSSITVGSPRLIWWQCAEGHEWKSSVRGMAKSNGIGQIGCGICYRKELSSGSKSLAEIWPDIAAEWDYEKNATTPDKIAQFSNKAVWWKCSINGNHSWETVVSNRTRFGSNCAICWQSGSASQAEEEVALFVEALGIAVERKVITILDNRKELDIYLPDYNVAIEYNGLHWHSEKYRERKYHYNKYQECKEKGITLIQIWEDDWLERQEIVKCYLASFFGKIEMLKLAEPTMPPEYFVEHLAENLSIKMLSAKEANAFFTQTHLKGCTESKYLFGLVDAIGNVAAVLAMSKTTVPGELIVERFATKGIIQGGFGKLLEYVSSIMKPKVIVAISDNALSDELIYEVNGFSKEGMVEEDYMYAISKKRYPKTASSELGNPNTNQRIWDAGKIRWVKVIKPV